MTPSTWNEGTVRQGTKGGRRDEEERAPEGNDVVGRHSGRGGRPDRRVRRSGGTHRPRTHPLRMETHDHWTSRRSCYTRHTSTGGTVGVVPGGPVTGRVRREEQGVTPGSTPRLVCTSRLRPRHDPKTRSLRSHTGRSEGPVEVTHVVLRGPDPVPVLESTSVLQVVDYRGDTVRDERWSHRPSWTTTPVGLPGPTLWGRGRGWTCDWRADRDTP